MVLPVRDRTAVDSGRKLPVEGCSDDVDGWLSEGDKTILRKGGELRPGGALSREN
jgi:hypothetical protein